MITLFPELDVVLLACTETLSTEDDISYEDDLVMIYFL